MPIRKIAEVTSAEAAAAATAIAHSTCTARRASELAMLSSSPEEPAPAIPPGSSTRSVSRIRRSCSASSDARVTTRNWTR